MTQPSHVWGLHSSHLGFGDRWACANWFLRLSQRTRKVVLISTAAPWASEIVQIAPLLRSTGRIALSQRPPSIHLDYCDPFRLRYLKTVVGWKPNNSQFISYQFDGRSFGHLKNLPPGAEERLLAELVQLGYKPINVNSRPALHAVEILARSAAFIGVPSGLSHVAFSVGTPCHVIFNDYSIDLRQCVYYRKPVKLYHTYEDLLARWGQ